MSNIIVHLDPRALEYRKLQKQDRDRHTIKQDSGVHIYEKINKLQVKEIEMKAKQAKAERDAMEAKRRLKDQALRQRCTRHGSATTSRPTTTSNNHNNMLLDRNALGMADSSNSGGISSSRGGGGGATPRKSLASISPRKDKRSVYSVADNSVEIEAEEDIGFDNKVAPRLTHQHGDLPAYLVKRKEEQHRAAQQKEHEALVEVAFEMMPEGQTPMDPRLAERTKQFLKKQISETTHKINSFSFSRRNSATGKMKLAQLEEDLYVAEETLKRFDFPLVFIERRNPQPAHCAPERLGVKHKHSSQSDKKDCVGGESRPPSRCAAGCRH